MEQKHLLGCMKSVLDGTEHKYSFSKSLDIPEEYSYEPYMAPIVNQVGNTCVCNSTISILDWKLNMKDGTYDFNGFDPNEIYSIRSNKFEDCGMTFKEALSYAKNHGVKYNKGIYKIGHYAMVTNKEMLKSALIENGPCLFAVPVYNDNYEDFWIGRGKLQGGHAMCFVGYNKDGFILRNSWGETYGENGYALLPYSDFDNVWEIWTVF